MANDPLNKYLRFVNIAFEMGVIIVAGVLFGIWLDGKIPNKYSGFTIFFSLFGVFVALYQVIKRLRDLTRDEE